MKKLSFYLLGLLALWACYIPPAVQAACEVQSATLTYANGAFIGGDLCDTAGNKKVTLGGAASGGLGTANAAAPTLAEGAGAAFSFDLSGNARMTLGTLLSGEDQTNNLLMTSGGAVRQTIVASVITTNTTSAAGIVPVGSKTFYGQVVCSSGACTQTQAIYGDIDSDAANGILLCTLTLSGTTRTQDACPVVTANFSYYYVVTTATTGTSATGAIYAMY